MTQRNDLYSKTTDLPFRNVGTGMVISCLCMGCNKPRAQAGGKGKGVKWRCAHCVAAREAAKAASAQGAQE